MRHPFKVILLLTAAAAFAAPGKPSRIRIESPLGQGHAIFIRGGGGGLGWSPESARRATEATAGVWELEVTLEGPVEFKPLLDNRDWLDSEQNLTLHPGETKSIVDPDFAVQAHGTLETKNIHGRTLRVYLPPGYTRGSRKRYPVIYMQDGDKLFGSGTDSWKAQLTADQMVAQGRMTASIIVGIDPASPTQRMNEYTPFAGIIHTNDGQTDFAKTGGGLFDYAKQIVFDLKPAVDAAYDTLTDREHTTIGGSSLGGLASLVIAANYPDTFGAVIGMSGTWFWGEVARHASGEVVRGSGDPRSDVVYHPDFSSAQYIREQLERNRLAGKPLPRVFLSVGESEWAVMHRSLERVKSELLSIGYQMDRDLFVYRNPMGRHSEESWSWQLRVPFTKLDKSGHCSECLLPVAPR